MNFSQDPRFTFDTFVVGPGNRMAAAAARRAAEQPRTAYNPLFIHGGPGTGKTHLLQAVGALALALRPELRVLYVTADGLVDRVSAAVGAGSMDALREQLLDADFILIDEAHQLAGRARSQEELLSLWDDLEKQAQIVIAAEGLTPDLPGVDDGLRARFIHGLAVDLPAAEADARPEIARRAAEQRGITLQGDAAEQIARLTGDGAAGLIAAVERVGAAQTERGGTLPADELAGVARPHAGSAHTMDEFSAFLSDISATVEEIVETAPWRRRLAESILRWEGEGVRTRRLEVALEADTAPDLDALLQSFDDDVARLRLISADLEALGADSAKSPVLRDPDRVGEAEALLVSARASAERKAEEVERARPQVDRWYFNAEKTALNWLALEDRVVESWPEMAIKGNLREASLPDVLQLLAMGQKTGCLSLTDRSNFGYVYFDRGRITYASIVNRRDRLGDLLVKNGLVTPQALASAIDEQGRDPRSRVGEILIRQGALTREQLEQYIRIQIEEAVYYLFTWTQGTFNFEAEQRPEEGAMLVSINPENLLLEGARRIDEWSLIEKKIPSLDLVFEVDRAKPVAGVELSDEQRKILPLVDGKRSVQELIDESGMVEFDVGKALFGLIQAGFAHPVGRRQAQVKEVPQARIDEHRNLGIAFYKTGMYDEATREFRRVAELQPRNLDARFHLALIGLRKGDDRFALRYLKEVVELGGSRAGVFQAMSLSLERLGRLPDARFASDEAVRLAPTRPQVLLSRAILMLKSGDVETAGEAFAKYREVLGERRAPASYYAFAILCHASTGGVDAALRLGEEGIALHPHSAPVHLHLGAVQERKGDWERAEALYRRATEEDRDSAPAHKALGDAQYRRGAYDEAAESYGRAVRLNPRLGDDVYFRMGNIHYKRMERTQAVELWRRALELNPQNSVVRTNLELVESVLR